MAILDFSIRTKLAAWATAGVVLVAGMLVNQQIGDRCAEQQRAEADNKQLAAAEALRAAYHSRSMQLETREIRLAIAPSEVDRVMGRLDGDQAAASAMSQPPSGSPTIRPTGRGWRNLPD